MDRGAGRGVESGADSGAERGDDSGAERAESRAPSGGARTSSAARRAPRTWKGTRTSTSGGPPGGARRSGSPSIVIGIGKSPVAAARWSTSGGVSPVIARRSTDQPSRRRTSMRRPAAGIPGGRGTSSQAGAAAGANASAGASSRAGVKRTRVHVASEASPDGPRPVVSRSTRAGRSPSAAFTPSASRRSRRDAASGAALST
ncbi:hypothetical protein WMF38_31675 [Sorangium sp. So ce118]